MDNGIGREQVEEGGRRRGRGQRGSILTGTLSLASQLWERRGGREESLQETRFQRSPEGREEGKTGLLYI